MKAYCDLCKHVSITRYNKFDQELFKLEYGIDVNVCKCQLHRKLYETPLNYYNYYGNCMELNKDNNCSDFNKRNS